MKLTQSVLQQQQQQQRPPSPPPLQLCHRRFFIIFVIFLSLLGFLVPVYQCKSIKSVRKTILSTNNLLEENLSGGLTKSDLAKALLNLLAATNNNTFEIATAFSNQLDEFRNSNSRNEEAGNDDTNEPNAVWAPSIQEFVPARYINNNNKNKNNYFDLEERMDLMGVGGRVRNSYDSTTTMNSLQQQGRV